MRANNDADAVDDHCEVCHQRDETNRCRRSRPSLFSSALSMATGERQIQYGASALLCGLKRAVRVPWWLDLVDFTHAKDRRNSGTVDEEVMAATDGICCVVKSASWRGDAVTGRE